MRHASCKLFLLNAGQSYMDTYLKAYNISSFIKNKQIDQDITPFFAWLLRQLSETPDVSSNKI